MAPTAGQSVDMLVAVATGSSSTLTWPTPTQNRDGSPLLDLAGYHYYVWSPDATSPVVTDVGLSGSMLHGIGAGPGTVEGRCERVQLDSPRKRAIAHPAATRALALAG
jgi:hypothetical protein